MRTVVDTNVLVSGLINPAGVPANMIDLIDEGKVYPLYDDRILAEYRSVFDRARFGFQPDRIRQVLRTIEQEGELIVAAPLAIELPDPTDIPFVEVAVAGAAEALVTGNTRHFQPVSGEHDVTVLNPREFIDLWLERQ